MDLTQQQQHITSQMSERPVALLIFAPAPLNLPPIQRQSLGIPGSFEVIESQSIPLLFKARDLLLEFVNLSAGPGLSAIKTAGVEEDGPTHLLVVFINGSSREKRVDAPVCP